MLQQQSKFDKLQGQTNLSELQNMKKHSTL